MQGEAAQQNGVEAHEETKASPNKSTAHVQHLKEEENPPLIAADQQATVAHDKKREGKRESFKSSKNQADANKEEADASTTIEHVGGFNSAEDELARLAWAFFTATTKSSTDNEDILPQEDSEDMQLSVFSIFAGLFPEAVGEQGEGELERKGKGNKRMRLHFNKIGYNIYSKEQSRRVPAVRAKPGNPGYGFRHARWRDTTVLESDGAHCALVLRESGCTELRIAAVLEKIQGTCVVWDSIRRPSRPAGPGRPRRPEDGLGSAPISPVLRHAPLIMRATTPKLTDARSCDQKSAKAKTLYSAKTPKARKATPSSTAHAKREHARSYARGGARYGTRVSRNVLTPKETHIFFSKHTERDLHKASFDICVNLTA